jgi:hypothetical protein
MRSVISAAHVAVNAWFWICFAAAAVKLCEAFFEQLVCLLSVFHCSLFGKLSFF